MVPRPKATVEPRAERPRRHKGFVLKRGKSGLITIINANGGPLSETMKFLEYETASAFLDRWIVTRNNEGKEGSSERALKTSNRRLRRKRSAHG